MLGGILLKTYEVSWMKLLWLRSTISRVSYAALNLKKLSVEKMDLEAVINNKIKKEI